MSDPQVNGGDAADQSLTRQVIIAESGSSVFAVLHGDMHVRNGHPVYLVRPFPLDAHAVPVGGALQRPSRLLAADAAIVPFTGRTAELAELAAWRDGPQSGVSVMLIHAPGGQGKTRLAARFAGDSAAKGWTPWAAHHFSDPTGEHIVAPGDPGRALVLIVDYADRWPVDDLLLLLDNPLLRRSERSRVLLVARPAGTWWPSLRHRLAKVGITIGPTLALAPVAASVAERHDMFTTARDAFAAQLSTSARQVSAPQLLAEDSFQLVLTIHMAALVAVDAYQRGTTPPADPVALSAYLLDREYDFWHALHDHRQITTDPQVMGRTVYTATLTHALHRTEAVRVLQRVRVATADTVSTALKDHTWCYPPLASGADSALEALYPDRLGEDFLALSTPGHTHPEYTADQWAEGVPGRLLTPEVSEVGSPPPYARQALIVLVETVRRWPHVAHRQLYPVLRAHPQLALAAGGNALAAIAEQPDISIDLLEAIEAHIPYDRHAELDTGIAALVQRLAEYRLAATTDLATRGRVYNSLAWRLRNAGQIQQSLAAAEKAVRTFRELSSVDPAAGEIGLAKALDIFGNRLSDLGRRDDALTAIGEAVQILQRLAAADPAASEVRHRLAEALHNYALRLSDAGRAEDALVAAEMAVQIRRQLAAADPAAFEPGLARALTNISQRLAHLGRYKEALIAGEEAVQVARRLAKINPAAFELELSASLEFLGAWLETMGRYEEALAAGEEAVQVARRLAKINPAAFEGRLAITLNELGTRLAAIGRVEEALSVTEEALQIRQRLAAASPAEFEGAVALSLNNMCLWLSRLGRSEQALAAAEQAVAIYRRLAATNRASEPAFAAALHNLGARLAQSGRIEEAVAVTKEVVEIRRRQTAAHPAVFEHDLAKALTNLGKFLANLGSVEEALPITDEATQVFRRLAKANPAAFEPNLATAISNRSVWLASMGRLDEALIMTKEALQIRRRLVAANPAAFEPDLASSLHNASVQLAKLGRRSEALAASEETLALYRRLSATNPAVFEPKLASFLSSQGRQLSTAGRHEEALAATASGGQFPRRRNRWRRPRVGRQDSVD